MGGGEGALMTIAVLAEKPSVARDLAKVLGANKKGNGFLHGNGYAVSWALGHLVALAQPHEVDPRWKKWRRELLPMLPASWPLVVTKKTKSQYEVVRRMITSPKVKEIICATDAGREGELIFRYIYEAAGSQKPIQRLWISSLTPAAIRQGLGNLRSGRDLEPLAAAARGRSRADWLVGMNLSRACTLAYGNDGEVLSVGRVQTPTLAMVVDRELEIRAFVPEPYLEVVAVFAPSNDEGDQKTYEGTYFQQKKEKDKPTAEAQRLPADGQLAGAVMDRARRGKAAVESVKSEKKTIRPPLLYDLTELQRHTNRLWGWSAKKTLQVAQKLYEEKKVLSYPRTDSRYLTQDVEKTLPNVVQAFSSRYQNAGEIAPGTGSRPLGRRFVDNAKVGDHHAIIPTDTPAGNLTADEERLYDLVCRRLLSAWHDDHIYSITTVITGIETQEEDQEFIDRYVSRGTTIEHQGWKILDLKPTWKKSKDPKNEEPKLPTGLRQGMERKVEDVRADEKKTRPPKRFTEATLLTAMETAGKTLEDKELSDAMRERGLGTPATRAETIETLLKREYIERQKKALHATDKGIHLIERVHPHVKSPAMTGEWEAKLKAIERGEGELPVFMEDIENYVREVVGGTLEQSQSAPAAPSVEPEWPEIPYDDSMDPAPNDGPPPYDGPPSWFNDGPPGYLDDAPPAEYSESSYSESSYREGQPSVGDTARPQAMTFPEVASSEQIQLPRRSQREPTSPDRLEELLRTEFGFAGFRPFQEPVCRAVTEGHDALVVMPTGAGKSLCYQLPGIARAGTTVVVSPLIALMEDQVSKLSAQGFAAERIHSGRGHASRTVARAYENGDLDFLFVAPERFSVPGFSEMLERRKPGIVAIDEAHCISHWGHDFRPDYRQLGKRLPRLRPAPIIGLTATATPVVQDDIVTQLGLHREQRFIHGFRRDNIAVEVVEMMPSNRRLEVRRLLGDESRRPAIVYAPSRKEANALGEMLATDYRAAAYHAGMMPADRDRVQTAFLKGDLEVIVATIAFGMGIDKPDIRTVVHTGLPGSVEGYYQEIGRAGRDGEPSSAVLLFSFADRRTHEFFFERDYPKVMDLARVHDVLGQKWISRDALYTRVAGLDSDTFEKALEKLWIHHGADVDPEENVRRGPATDWRLAYKVQRDHKHDQLQRIVNYATSHRCRMLQLVEHFGDREDSGQRCGQCDVCAPERSRSQRFREPTPGEQSVAQRIFRELAKWDGQGKGALFKKVCPDNHPTRDVFEGVLGGLVRAGLLALRDDSFEKDGRQIRFQRAALTDEGFHTATALSSQRAAVAFEVIEKAPSRKGRSTRTTQRKTTTRKTTKKRSTKKASKPEAALPAPPANVVDALKAWRLKEARRRRVPAFTVLTNKTLEALARDQPKDEAALLQVKGIGPTLVKKYGAAILKILAPFSQ